MAVNMNADRNTLFLRALKDRQLLQALSQVSYAYSQINKNYSRIEDMTEDELANLLDIYAELFDETIRIITKYELEQSKHTTA